MARSRQTGPRHLIVAVLAFVLTLGSVGRGFAGGASPEASRAAAAGAHGPICHSGPGPAERPDAPLRSAGHDCCDACLLLAPAVLPAAPALAGPSAVRYDVATAPRGAAFAPAGARLRSQHRSRAPPAA